MALQTPGDLIALALKYSGAIGVGNTPMFEDTNDAFTLLNMILTEWQINRWLVPNLIETSGAMTSASSYTVGPGGHFNISGVRPDKIDAAYAIPLHVPALPSVNLYPWASREGWDRVPLKGQIGTPVTYFYDPGIGTLGTIYINPCPTSSWVVLINSKVYMGQYTSLTDSLALPPQYVTALFAVLSHRLRPLYGLPVDPQIESAANNTLQALVNSVAQVPQAVQSVPSNRAGVFSAMPPVPQGNNQ